MRSRHMFRLSWYRGEDFRVRHSRLGRRPGLWRPAGVRRLVLEALEDRTLLDAAAPDFVARRDFHTAQQPDQVVVGDFNGDGIPDLATADLQAEKVSVLLGNGDGT